MYMKIIVTNNNYQEILNSVLPDTFQIQETLNGAWQVQFTALDDRSLAYSLLQIQNHLLFAGEEYVIKQCQRNYQSGVNNIQVTATHIGFDVQRVFQHAVNNGVKSYSVNDVLSFYLNGNPYGYTWKVIGNFGNQNIENLGNSNGNDMLSKIKSTWTNSVFYPDNKCIQIFDSESFKKDTGKVITYKGNSNTLQLTYDSTNLCNKLQCVSVAKDGSNDKNPQYYFQPFYVQDNDSINQYGVFEGSPISDNRFHDENSMRQYGLSKLQPQPTLAIQGTFNCNDTDIQLGEIRHLIIPELNLSTDVEVTQITLYPLSQSQPSQYQLNSVQKTILDYNNMLHNNTGNTVKTDVVINQSVQNAIANNKAEIDKINSSIKQSSVSFNLNNNGTMVLTRNNNIIYVSLTNATLKANTALINGIYSDYLGSSNITGNFIVSSSNGNYIVNYELDTTGDLNIKDIYDLSNNAKNEIDNVNSNFNYMIN